MATKKLYLEFFRGVASVYIVGWHMAFLAPTGHPTRLAGYWGADGLIMFFILSGVVINISESRRPKSRAAFLRNRFVRIYPQFVGGMLLALLALYITGTAFPSFKTITGNFLMVSTMSDYMGYIVPSIQSNLPVWSLSFEVAFYVMFAFTIGRNQKKALRWWLAMSLVAIPLFFLHTQRDVLTHVIAVFAFSSIWLVGYYVYKYRDYFYADKYTVLFGLGVLPLISRMRFSHNFYDPLTYLIFAIFAIPVFRYCLQLPPAGKKIKMIYFVFIHFFFIGMVLIFRYIPLENALVYSTLPYVYMGLFYLIERAGLKQKLIRFVNRAGRVLGKYSYSLYISHYPIVFIFSKLTHNLALYIICIPPLAALMAYSLENWLQPAVAGIFIKKRSQEITENQPAWASPKRQSPHTSSPGERTF